MARRNRGTLGMFLTLSILVLAAYGGWIIWHKPEVQRAADKVERTYKAASKEAGR